MHDMTARSDSPKIGLRTQLVVAVPLFMASVLAPDLILAPATEATILGTVLDASGAAVPGAEVAVTNVATGLPRKTVTNASGEYVITNLPLGTYTVAAEVAGFKRARHPSVGLTIKARVRVDLTLE